MRLTALSVAYPFAPVGPRSVGGAEQILSNLDRALVAAGHNSIVIACNGSEPAGELIGVAAPESDIAEENAQSECRVRFQQAIDWVVRSRPVDLVHMHGLDFHRFRIPARVPVLVTLHMPISWYPSEAWTRFPQYRYCCVSESQRCSCPPELSGAVVIENGVSLPLAPATRAEGQYALVLGRICPEKNAHEALEAGTQAGLPVWLAGRVFPYPEHVDYFRQKVEPLLRERRNGLQHRFLGAVGRDERNRLLAGARCLLHPTLAPETSSLVAMEALAMGTPVVAYPSGALPEVVEDGVTGFLVGGVEEMASALSRVAEIWRHVCRRAAEQRFDSRRMVARYFDLYESMVRSAPREVLHA